MSFDVTATAYGRFMGRYSQPLASRFVQLVDLRPGQRVLDVGCGAGALTSELVPVVGVDAVSALDPSEPFVAAVAEAFPGIDVRRAGAESLPYDDATFDQVLAQLVVHFMADPQQGLREMARVAAPGGTVAASVWDHSGGRGPLSLFWEAAREQDTGVTDESHLAGSREGDLALLFMAAGMPGATAGSLEVDVEHETFEQWWDPYTLGVGPAGAHVASLSAEQRDDLRERCRALLPEPPFTMSALAWTAVWEKPVG